MEKCTNCGKVRSQHHAKDSACPIGKRHRIYGYTQFQQLLGNIEFDSIKMYKRSFDSPEVGCSYIREGKPVYVIGRHIDNRWNFQPINKDGTLGKQQWCYGHEFTEKIKCKVITKVLINWEEYQDLDL